MESQSECICYAYKHSITARERENLEIGEWGLSSDQMNVEQNEEYMHPLICPKHATKVSGCHVTFSDWPVRTAQEKEN